MQDEKVTVAKGMRGILYYFKVFYNVKTRKLISRNIQGEKSLIVTKCSGKLVSTM